MNFIILHDSDKIYPDQNINGLHKHIHTYFPKKYSFNYIDSEIFSLDELTETGNWYTILFDYEMISPTLLHFLPNFLDQDVSLITVPRINIPEDVPDNHPMKEDINSLGFYNYPDYQSRIFKFTDGVRWMNGYITTPYSELILKEKEYSIIHKYSFYE